MILWLFMAVAAAAQLSLELENRKLALGQTVPLTLQLINGSFRGQPEIPVGDGLTIQFTGQSSQKVAVNFQTTDIVRFNYQLTAIEPGQWSVGPVNLGRGANRVHANAIAVEVSTAPATTGKEAVGATISDADPVLGQVVVYRFTFRHEQPLVDAGWNQPAFDGFVEEQIAEPKQREYRVEEDGKTFKVQTIDVPLVAAGEGARSIPPAVLTAKYQDQRRRRRRRGVDDLFRDSPFAAMRNVRTMTHSTLPVPVEIRPLPEGAPAHFDGLVGQFKVDVRTDTRRLALGESATLEYRIQGNGTLSGFRLPTLATDAGFRVYDDAAEVKAGMVYEDKPGGGVPKGRFMATALVRRAVVPEATGSLTVPSVRIPVYDSERGVYDTITTAPVVLQVDPGESGAGVVESYAGQGGVTQRAVASLGEDILPVTRPDRMSNATARGALPVMAALPALPLIAWLSALVFGWVQTRRVEPRVLLHQRLHALPGLAAERVAALESIFLEAAGIRLNRPAPGLDRDAILPLGEDAVGIYDALVRARYGGMEAQIESLEEQIRSFVGGL